MYVSELIQELQKYRPDLTVEIDHIEWDDEGEVDLVIKDNTETVGKVVLESY